MTVQAGSTQIVIFANPSAGRGSARDVAFAVAHKLRAAGFTPDVRFERPNEWSASDVSPNAAVSIGGDGTLRGVVARLSDAYPEPPPVVIVPMGTANLMGRHLDQPRDVAAEPERVCRAILDRRIRWTDAGSANGSLFLLMAGIGFDAAVVHELDRIRNGPIGYASYAVPAALALSRYSFPPIHVAVDGQSVFDSRPGVAFVANVPEYGTGFPIIPHAVADDGLLDVCVAPVDSITQLLGFALRAAMGTHLQSEGCVYARGAHITITSPVPVPVQLDGDSAGHTPVIVQARPRSVPLML